MARAIVLVLSLIGLVVMVKRTPRALLEHRKPIVLGLAFLAGLMLLSLGGVFAGLALPQ